ncbi:MAG: beta-propeller domain-containing protein, partial [Planctomycetota bacterium]|nr:beta-propeller domain-containing protein [Planctomycetota bacterium]
MNPRIPNRLATRLLLTCSCLALLAGCDTLLRSNALTGAAGLDAPAASPAPEVSGDSAAGAAAAVREIEEADVVKQVGDKIYILNRLKGFIIVDAADADNPKVVGSTELPGNPVEMFVVDRRAFVVLSADYGFDLILLPAGSPLAGAPQPEFNGSQIAIVDIADPTRPTVLGKISLAGFASQSRRVGDVLYVVGRNLPSFLTDPLDPDNPVLAPEYYEEERAFVASINVADPADIRPVDRKTFRGGAVEMHVSTEAIFAAGYLYDADLAQSFTRVQYADITDPTGLIEIRGAVRVPGHIRNRFYMDDFERTFRICTQSRGFGFNEVRLFTYDISDPDNIKPLGETEIIKNESLRAVRFDGPRAYVVTFLQIDPLFVIDLSDPAKPTVTGALDVPGFSTHIVPRGDRLIAIGIDDTEGRRPAVAYYDVSDPTKPTQLSRVILGPPYTFTESEAVYDEKAFKILDELGLIVIPFSHASFDFDETPIGPPPPLIDGPGPLPGGGPLPGATPSSRPKCVNAVQLVEFSDRGLKQRGWFDARSRVQRVGIISDRIFAISQAGLQTIDISDRDNPVQAGEAAFFEGEELARFGCSDFFIDEVPIPIPIDGILDLTVAELLAQIIRSTDMCATVSVVPMISLVAGMTFMRRGRRRRRK